MTITNNYHQPKNTPHKSKIRLTYKFVDHNLQLLTTKNNYCTLDDVIYSSYRQILSSKESITPTATSISDDKSEAQPAVEEYVDTFHALKLARN